MPPSVGLALWVILIIGFLRFDPARPAGASPALWPPLIWMFILGSRLPAQWFSGDPNMAGGRALEDGNPIDRNIQLLLIAIALGLLSSRSFQWRAFFTSNKILSVFLVFALISASWSDFPMVALKRWFRDFGNYLMVLVVLSDRNPGEAFVTVVRRLCAILISLSVLLIKYYPQIGRGYDSWTGAAVYNGVTTSKYILAVLCLISGVYFFWDTVARWHASGFRRAKSTILVNGAFLVMTLWVLNLADGATCRVCLIFACSIIIAAKTRIIKKSPMLLKAVLPIIACMSLFLVFGVDMKATIAEAVGRNPTFTDRTLLWAYLLTMHVDPILGTGYETFWLGPRLEELWSVFAFMPNQAHNGFLEVYLNLGLMGVLLAVGVMAATYKTICKMPLAAPMSMAPLSLALWTVLPICSITTAVFFKSEILWVVFLLTCISVPKRRQSMFRTPDAEGRNGVVDERLWFAQQAGTVALHTVPHGHEAAGWGCSELAESRNIRAEL
jgi:hypothetical protein